MTSFEDYKSRVSIIQVLEDLGYKYDRKDGALSPVFKLKNHNGDKIDEVIIKNPKNNSSQYYYDRNFNKGDLISFIKNHINDFPQFQHPNQFVRINMILSHYSNIPYVAKYEEYSKSKEQQPFNPSRFSIAQPGLKDLSYLTKGRFIDPKTVEKFLPFISLVKDSETKGDFVNIGFPYRIPGKEDIVNYELRNYEYKGMAQGGNKIDALWIADFTSHPNLVKHIFAAESAIDAISYYELNASKININEVAFLSYGGYVTDNQIKNMLDHFKNATVHSIADNDINGHLYDIKIHSHMAKQEVKITKKENGDILFKTTKNEFVIPKEEVSIERFRKESNTVAPLRVHKTKEGKDYNELLKISKTQKVNLISNKL